MVELRGGSDPRRATAIVLPLAPEPFPRWVEPLAWDSTGALYSLWTNIKGIWPTRSLDSGATWKTWRVAEIDDLSYYPYLTARGQGLLAAT